MGGISGTMVSALCNLVRWELTSPTQRRLGSVPHHLNCLASHFHPILCSLDSLPRYLDSLPHCLDSPPCHLDPLLCRLRLHLHLHLPPPPLRLLPPSLPPAMSLHRPARSQTSSTVMVQTRSPVRRLPIASSSICVMRSLSTQRLVVLRLTRVEANVDLKDRRAKVLEGRLQENKDVGGFRDNS